MLGCVFFLLPLCYFYFEANHDAATTAEKVITSKCYNEFDFVEHYLLTLSLQILDARKYTVLFVILLGVLESFKFKLMHKSHGFSQLSFMNQVRNKSPPQLHNQLISLWQLSRNH